MPPSFALAIEISNPSSGPRGPVTLGNGRRTLAGPGVALARLNADGSLGPPDTELLNEFGRHDDDLMPAIDRLFRRAGARPADLSRIAVSIGPGGYTSLRIAVATAKMLAETTGAAAFPIPSALSAAFFARSDAATLVCLASKADTTHATLLPAGEGRFVSARALGLIDAAALETIRPGLLVADGFLPDPIREAAAGLSIPIVAPTFAAESLLDLMAFAAPIDTLALAPLYPRQAEAVTQWRLRHPA